METGNGQVVDTGLEAKGPPDGLADERRHWSKGTAPAFYRLVVWFQEIKAVPIRHDK